MKCDYSMYFLPLDATLVYWHHARRQVVHNIISLYVIYRKVIGTTYMVYLIAYRFAKMSNSIVCVCGLLIAVLTDMTNNEVRLLYVLFTIGCHSRLLASHKTTGRT